MILTKYESGKIIDKNKGKFDEASVRSIAESYADADLILTDFSFSEGRAVAFYEIPVFDTRVTLLFDPK